MKSKPHSPPRQQAGFTLVELLVVIAIIGILAGMSLAVIPRVMDSARKQKAKLEAQGIATAIEHYDSTYGRFPVSAGVQGAAGTAVISLMEAVFDRRKSCTTISADSVYVSNNSEVIAILMNLTDYPDGSGPTVNANYQKNPQKNIFLNAKMTEDNTLPGVGKDLVYRDPWGTPYVISIDLNFDDQTEDAFYARNLVSQSAPSSQSRFEWSGQFIQRDWEL